LDDADAMRSRERRGDPDGRVERLPQLQLAGLDQPPQRPPFDVLGDEEAQALRFAELLDGDDVRVIERRGRSRLALEAADTVCVGCEERPQTAISKSGNSVRKVKSDSGSHYF
jgi:hypothetical protein